MIFNESIVKGNNQENAKESNRALVLESIWKKNSVTRKGLSDLTGLKQATITNIVNDLLAWNLIRESGKKNNGPGRNLIELEIIPSAFNVLSIRFTRKFFLVGVFDLAGNNLNEKCIHFNINDGFVKISNHILEICKNYLKENNKIMSVGIALPGPIIKNEENVIMMIDFPEAEQVNIKKLFEEGLKIPVSITHDANAGLLAEWVYGKTSNDNLNIMYIAAGQGNGLGLLLNGSIYEGATGTAGELGHMSICFDGPICECGNYGCLDLYCSVIQLSRNIEKNIKRYPNTVLTENSNTQEIIEAIINNDELAVKEFKDMIYYLSIALINLVNTYNPSELIIGDELSKVGDLLLETIDSVLKNRMKKEIYDKLSIRLSKFSGDAVLLGAAASAVRYMFKRPSIIEQNLL